MVCTDFTYMRQPNGKFRYNCTIMDLFDRSAIASVNSDYINTELAIETLTEALKKEKPSNGILLHSDQGVQYTSWEFVNFCKDHGVIQSMSKAGCPYDNAPMERFLFDRSAIASVNSDYINTELAIETLTEALKKEKPSNGILLHSDQGVQYTSWEFVNFCKDHGVIQSMSKAGCPYDNAPMERFYNTFKSCFYYRYTFESVEQLDEKC